MNALKKIKPTIYSLLILFLFYSCKKEKIEVPIVHSIKYEVESNYNSALLIEWTGKDGGINGSAVKNANWTKDGSTTYFYSFETDKALDIYFSGQNTNVLSNANIKLFVNDSLVQTATANSQLKAVINYKL